MSQMNHVAILLITSPEFKNNDFGLQRNDAGSMMTAEGHSFQACIRAKGAAREGRVWTKTAMPLSIHHVSSVLNFVCRRIYGVGPLGWLSEVVGKRKVR